MSLPRNHVTALAAIVFIFGAAPPATAVVLDWSSVTWTAGTLSNSYDIDPNVAGNDITVTVSGDTNRLTTDPVTGLQTPAITNSLEGGTAPVDSALHIGADLHTNDTITITVTFSAAYTMGVENVSFKLFDIDAETNEDRVQSISATPYGGGSPYAATISNLGSAVTLTGSGLGQVLTGVSSSPNTGASSGNGNATIGFGSNVIQSFSFTFANTPGAPRLQQISIHDISFTPVPEINPGLAAAALTLVASHLARLRSKRTKARPAPGTAGAKKKGDSPYVAPPFQTGSGRRVLLHGVTRCTSGDAGLGWGHLDGRQLERLLRH